MKVAPERLFENISKLIFKSILTCNVRREAQHVGHPVQGGNKVLVTDDGETDEHVAGYEDVEDDPAVSASLPAQDGTGELLHCRLHTLLPTHVGREDLYLGHELGGLSQPVLLRHLGDGEELPAHSHLLLLLPRCREVWEEGPATKQSEEENSSGDGVNLR